MDATWELRSVNEGFIREDFCPVKRYKNFSSLSPQLRYISKCQRFVGPLENCNMFAPWVPIALGDQLVDEPRDKPKVYETLAF